jgi:hypothetical protein
VFDLSISQNQPYQTVSTTVPAPGVYSYRIEQSEVQQVMPAGAPTGYLEPVRFDMSGEGKIDIQRGAAFRVHGILD